MSFDSIIFKVSRAIKDNLSTILSFTAIGGVAGTVAVTYVETKKFVKKQEELKDKDLKPKEIVKEYAPIVAPVAGVALGTITLIILSEITNAGVQRKLSNALGLTGMLFNKYRQEVKDEIGDDKEQELFTRVKNNVFVENHDSDIDRWRKVNEIPEQLFLWYEPISQTLFEASWSEVIFAMYELNRIFACKGIVKIEDFLLSMPLNSIRVKEPTNEKSRTLGWSDYYLSDEWDGTWWIDYYITEHNDGVEDYNTIHFPIPPVDLEKNGYA